MIFLFFLPGDTTSAEFHTQGADVRKSYRQPLSWPNLVSSKWGQRVWKELLQKPALETPKRCDHCPVNRQANYWRTFTQTSLRLFKEQGGVGKWFDESAAKEVGGCMVIPKYELDKPGFLWTTRHPEFALSVGIARWIATHEPIRLIGIHVCPCDLSQGTKMIYVGCAKGTNYIIQPVDGDSFPPQEGWSDGIIINHLTPQQMEGGVSYDVDMNFFTIVKQKTANSIGDEERKDSEIFRLFTHRIDSLLTEIACKDPNTDPSGGLYDLPRTWSAFLHRIPNTSLDTAVDYHHDGV